VLREFGGTHLHITQDSAEGADPQCVIPVNGHRGSQGILRQNVMAAPNSDYGESLDSRKRTISAPVGLGSLGMNRAVQLEVQMA
jgi:hypothetical protein